MLTSRLESQSKGRLGSGAARDRLVVGKAVHLDLMHARESILMCKECCTHQAGEA